MDIFKKKPKMDYVCCKCKTAKRHLVPVMEIREYSDSVDWYCLSCLGEIVLKAFFENQGITGHKGFGNDLFIENLKFLEKRDLAYLLKQLEKNIKEGA